MAAAMVATAAMAAAPKKCPPVSVRAVREWKPCSRWERESIAQTALKSKDVRRSRWNESRFSQATIHEGNWSGANFNLTRWNNTQVRNATMLGTDWTGAQVFRSEFNQVLLRGASLRAAKFEDVDFVDVDFTGADLSDAIFIRGSCTNCTFERSLQAGTIWLGMRGMPPRKEQRRE